MKKNGKEILITCVIALALMLIVPGAFRVWMAFSPAPSAESSPGATILDLAAIETGRAMILVRKPLDSWTGKERESETALYAWLGAHAKTVLPWEWSAAARAKDSSGYSRLWKGLLDEQREVLEKSLRDIRRRKKTLVTDMENETVLYVHATNESSRLSAIVSTNAYPSVVMEEKLSKGRFWGWNRDQEPHALPDISAAHALVAAIASNGVSRAGRMRELRKRLDEEDAGESVHVKLIEDEVSCCKRLSGKVDSSEFADSDDERIRLLLRLVRFAARCRAG